MSKKYGRAALLHILVAAENEYFDLKDVTLEPKQLTFTVMLGEIRPHQRCIKEYWERYNMIKR